MRCYFYTDERLCLVELIDTRDDDEAIARARELFRERRERFTPPLTSFELLDGNQIIYWHREPGAAA